MANPTTRAQVEAEFAYMINAHQKEGAVSARCASLGIGTAPPTPIVEEDDDVLFDVPDTVAD